MNDRRGALHDYGKASELYQQLGEQEEAAKAQWEELRLKDKIPREALSLLQSEGRYAIRIAALSLDQERSRVRHSATLSRRKVASKAYWQQTIRDARGQVAREEKEW